MIGGCKSDADCPLDKTCYNRQCLNPCIISNRCATLPLGCDSDAECPLDKACDNRQCIDPCLYRNPCAQNAICYVLNHQAQCHCPQGLVGNPREYCRQPEPEAQPECLKDADCPRGYGCIDQSCKDLCRALNPCHHTAICKVFDTSPIKTTTCSCPPGTIGDGYSACGKF